jgi:hypothetical protein
MSLTRKLPRDISGNTAGGVNRHQIRTSALPMPICKALLLAFVSLVPVACLVVPVRSTYYEPNAMDGTPERSVSASKRKDTVGRAVEGVSVHVHAETTAQQNLIVGIRISCHDESIAVNPNLIALQAVTEDKTFQAQSVVNRNSHSDQSNKTSYWITLTFPDTAAANEIAIVFAPGSIKKDGTDLALQPFRFARVTKWNVHVY